MSFRGPNPFGAAGDGGADYGAPPGPGAPAGRAGLIAAVRRKLGAMIAGHPEIPATRPLADTTVTGAADATYTSFADRNWNIYYDRRARYWDLQDMDRNSPLVSTALTIIAEATVCIEDLSLDGFDWQLALKNEEALKVLNDMKRRVKLGSESFQIVRNFVQYGEEYREIVVDPNGLVQAFNSLPSYTIMPRFDRLGNRLPGWDQKPEQAGLQKIPFDEWQIVSFQHGPKQSNFFGTGLLTSARRAWRRHEKLCDGMAIARLVRAYDPFVHKVPVKPDWPEQKIWEKITKYREAISKRRGVDGSGNMTLRDDPWTASTDIFIPDDGTNRGGVEVLSRQNMQLMNVTDLEYHRDEILTAIRVPRKYLNMVTKGQSSTSSAIVAEDRQFARLLRNNQATFRGGMEILGATALLLQGWSADDLGLQVRMAKINVTDFLEDAKVQMTEAQAAQLFSTTILQGSLPWELVASKYMSLTDEEHALMATFMKAFEADQKRAEREAAKANARGGRAGGATGETPTVKQMAELFARWGMLAQAEAESQGFQFGIGYTERYFQALDELSGFSRDQDLAA